GVENYSEQLVMQSAIEQLKDQDDLGSADFVADVVCVALNHLPPRYFRHHVDLSFYMSPQERLEIENKVNLAVESAIKHVRSNQRD
ncbi:MAG: late competence development ComFB family protein, partial [Gammaproteobacteria bacterium]|nr:late competence development ComFB family protein [Gammaproteobacteria bacterium]